MIHLGDITKISGYEVPVVDCVIGGSPCQDLSIAGKRAGLAGERSGLYMEQIRIIKEMREQDVRNNGGADRPVRPRYMVWENVPGAFSSNKGKDFAAVLEEAIRIAEPEAPDVPVPPKGWPTAGSIMGDGWSIAWRTHDAQYWGVPQRRKRISLIADFGGKSAPEILFECQSMQRDSQQGSQKRKGPSEGTEGSTSYAVRIRGGCEGGGKGALVQKERSDALGTGNDQTVFCLQENGIDRADTAGCNGKGWREDQCYTLNTIDRPAVCVFNEESITNKTNASNPHYGDPCHTLGSTGAGRTICVSKGFDGYNGAITDDVSSTLGVNCRMASGRSGVFAIENHPADSRVKISDKDLCQALTGRMGTGGGNVPMVMGLGNGQETVGTLMANAGTKQWLGNQEAFSGSYHIINKAVKSVRRLTPLECERLQGFPDNWTNIGEWIDSKGKKHDSSDSARYKALGNSIALPFWRFLCKRISAQYARKATMASLFDGIGGFPLVWEEWNGKGSAVWASEIEEFPIAVTKYHFGE